MSRRSFPHLGRDPAPGDVELTRGVARQVSALSVELGRIVAEVDGANGGEWTGQTAEAFRATLRDELLPLLRKARDSFDRAGHSLGGWAEALAGFQAEAQALEREAASRQATLDAARRALSYSPSGADAIALASLDDNLARATSAVSQLEHQADELHHRYLQAASSVAGELDQAGWTAPTEPGDWLERLGESIRSWIEEQDASWDLLAGDLWLDLAIARGETVTNAVEFFTKDWAKSTGWIGQATSQAKVFGHVMSSVGIIADAFTVYDPPDQGVMGWVDRGAGVVNAGLVAANLFMDEIPVVGQVVMIGTGIYLGGDYAYHHWRWFHDTCDTVGHFVATTATAYVAKHVEAMEAVAEGVKQVAEGHMVEGAEHVASAAWHTVTGWW